MYNVEKIYADGYRSLTFFLLLLLLFFMWVIQISLHLLLEKPILYIWKEKKNVNLEEKNQSNSILSQHIYYVYYTITLFHIYLVHKY